VEPAPLRREEVCDGDLAEERVPESEPPVPRIGRENVLPELSRTRAKVRERTRPDRLRKDYREFLLWLHANVLDSATERLFFAPTKGTVPLDGLTVRGNNRPSGPAYKPAPALVFKWARTAVPSRVPSYPFFTAFDCRPGSAAACSSSQATSSAPVRSTGMPTSTAYAESSS